MGLNNRKVNLFIVGAAKCGTTSLHDWLDLHADVAMCRVKEPNFFATYITADKSVYILPPKNEKVHYRIIKDAAVYDSLFEVTSDKKIIGESSVVYLWDADAPQKIRDYNPDAKIIIMLRNPVERAYSHYLMMYNIGQERETDFLTALKNDQLKPKIQGKSYLYLDYGHYHTLIKRYLALFSQQNVLLLSFNDLIANPTKTAAIVYDFLDIKPQNIRFVHSNSFTPTYGFQRAFRRFMSSQTNLLKLYWFIKQKIGFKRLLPTPKTALKPPFTEKARAFLTAEYAEDRALLERDFGIYL